MKSPTCPCPGYLVKESRRDESRKKNRVLHHPLRLRNFPWLKDTKRDTTVSGADVKRKDELTGQPCVRLSLEHCVVYDLDQGATCGAEAQFYIHSYRIFTPYSSDREVQNHWH